MNWMYEQQTVGMVWLDTQLIWILRNIRLCWHKIRWKIVWWCKQIGIDDEQMTSQWLLMMIPIICRYCVACAHSYLQCCSIQFRPGQANYWCNYHLKMIGNWRTFTKQSKSSDFEQIARSLSYSLVHCTSNVNSILLVCAQFDVWIDVCSYVFFAR